MWSKENLPRSKHKKAFVILRLPKQNGTQKIAFHCLAESIFQNSLSHGAYSERNTPRLLGVFFYNLLWRWKIKVKLAFLYYLNGRIHLSLLNCFFLPIALLRPSNNWLDARYQKTLIPTSQGLVFPVWMNRSRSRRWYQISWTFRSFPDSACCRM